MRLTSFATRIEYAGVVCSSKEEVGGVLSPLFAEDNDSELTRALSRAMTEKVAAGLNIGERSPAALRNFRGGGRDLRLTVERISEKLWLINLLGQDGSPEPQDLLGKLSGHNLVARSAESVLTFPSGVDHFWLAAALESAYVEVFQREASWITHVENRGGFAQQTTRNVTITFQQINATAVRISVELDITQSNEWNVVGTQTVFDTPHMNFLGLFTAHLLTHCGEY